MGSNLGDKHENILEALDRMNMGECRLVKISSMYETEPWGGISNHAYLNAVAIVHTTLVPQSFLQKCLGVEAQMGRYRQVKWEDRIIDIDVLFFNDLILESPELTIPHPLLHQRNFVLAPLREIDSEFIHPKLNKTIEELYLECLDKKGTFQVSEQSISI